MNSNKNIKTSMAQATAVCLLASLFYLYVFCLQVSPGVMTNELMRTFNVGSIGLGTLSAFYYYSYTPMQLPAGMLYDRFGPRILIPITILICVIGTLFFSLTSNIVIASYGRFMMGFGSAFSFIGTLLLISRWFPAKYFAVLAGLAQLMSSVGAVFGEAPLASAIHFFGWQHSMFFLAAVGVVLAIASWLVIRDFPRGHATMHATQRSQPLIEGLWKILHNRQTCWIAIYSFFIWGPIIVFAALWGIPFIAQRYHISITLASSAISMVWIGAGVGSPLLGWISEGIELRRMLLVISGIVGLISSILIIYLLSISFFWMYVLLFCLGLSAAGQSLAFAVIKDITEPKYMGTAVGFNNMAVVAGGALLQPLVGFLLHLFWNGEVINGANYYSILAFQKSLLILPVCYFGAIVFAWCIKETHCRHDRGQMTEDRKI